MKLIIAAFFTAMMLLFTWVAADLAVGPEHAWKVVSIVLAGLFGFGAIMIFMHWFIEGDGDW